MLADMRRAFDFLALLLLTTSPVAAEELTALEAARFRTLIRPAWKT